MSLCCLMCSFFFPPIVTLHCGFLLFQRFFLLEKGILKYSKSQQDVSDLRTMLMLILHWAQCALIARFNDTNTFLDSERKAARLSGRERGRHVHQQEVQTHWSGRRRQPLPPQGTIRKYNFKLIIHFVICKHADNPNEVINQTCSFLNFVFSHLCLDKDSRPLLHMADQAVCSSRLQEERGHERPSRRPPRSLHGSEHPACYVGLHSEKPSHGQ